VIWEDSLVMFFFYYDRSALGNGGRKSICDYLGKDRYFIVFYLCFFPRWYPSPEQGDRSLKPHHSYSRPKSPISTGCGEIPFMSGTFVGRARTPVVPKSPPRRISSLTDIYSERTGKTRDESVPHPITSHLPDKRMVSPGIDKEASGNINCELRDLGIKPYNRE